MKKNFFAKSLSALLALVMVLSVFAVLPISADTSADAPAEVKQAEIVPYTLADNGDLLYTLDFRGDSAFTNADYLSGQNGTYMYKTNKSFTPSADGSEVTIEGEWNETTQSYPSGSDFVWWGGEIDGLYLPQDGMISLTYQAKAMTRPGYTSSTNNSASVGGVAAAPLESDIYVNYGNNCAINGDRSFTRDDRPIGDSLWRSAINRSQTGIGKSAVDGVSLSGRYVYFDDLPKKPLFDADGYMTTLIEYDAKNGKINTYYLAQGTGDLKADWQPVQTADYTWTENDVVGYWTFVTYNLTYQSLKNVNYYKGTVYQSSPLVTVGTPEELAALNTTLAGADLAASNVVRVQLTADIDMSATAYTPVTTAKTIQFNGNGHTISNLSVGTAQLPVKNAGLFATAGADSSFRNFKLVDVSVYGTEFTGAVVANPVYGNLTITNVSVSGSVTDATADADLSGHVGFAGGFVGGNDKFDMTIETASEVTWVFAYCTNAANVNAPVSAAGIVGASCGAINYDVDYCANTGNITVAGKGSKNSDNQAAGLINARHHGYSTNDTMVDGSFRNCFNTGKLTLLLLQVLIV